MSNGATRLAVLLALAALMAGPVRCTRNNRKRPLEKRSPTLH